MRLISGGNVGIEQRDTGVAATMFGAEEQRMVRGVLSMADKPISAVMTLRRDLDCLDLADAEPKRLEQLRASRHASLVVIREGKSDSPLGVIHKKRLLDVLLDGQPAEIEVLIEQPLVLLENTSLVEALGQFQRSGEMIAFVVDEFGTLEGVATLLDIMRDLSEEDLTAPGGQARIRRIGDDVYDVDASEDMVDVNQQLPEPLPLDRNYTSLAGLVIDRLETLPYIGATVDVEPWRIEIRDVERHRVRRVRLRRLDADGR
nr:transporter associated domain-containing protein [Salinicola rhizosphaerae]